MAASRAARKREMIANLENEEYLNDLANESYAIIFTQSTTNTVAQKKVKKAFDVAEASVTCCGYSPSPPRLRRRSTRSL